VRSGFQNLQEAEGAGAVAAQFHEHQPVELATIGNGYREQVFMRYMDTLL
jgi:hypothetical protein